MNLHQVVAGAINAVNPFIPATFRVSTGYTTDAAGNRTPTYTDVAVTAQVQPVTYTDIQLLDGLELNGERRAIYVNGRFDSINRSQGTGGDLIVFAGNPASVFPYGTTWKVAITAEQFPDWVKVLATLQAT